MDLDAATCCHEIRKYICEYTRFFGASFFCQMSLKSAVGFRMYPMYMYVQNVPEEEGAYPCVPEADKWGEDFVSLTAESKRKRPQRFEKTPSSATGRQQLRMGLTDASIRFPFFSILPGLGAKSGIELNVQMGLVVRIGTLNPFQVWAVVGFSF